MGVINALVLRVNLPADNRPQQHYIYRSRKDSEDLLLGKLVVTNFRLTDTYIVLLYLYPSPIGGGNS